MQQPPCTGSKHAFSAADDADTTDAQVLVPPLREMEAYVFDHMVRYLWCTLIEVRRRDMYTYIDIELCIHIYIYIHAGLDTG